MVDNERPQNRKELEKVKARFENKVQMAYHYHQDPFLPLELKVMFWASHSLLSDYEQTLKTHNAGQDKGFKHAKKSDHSVNFNLERFSQLCFLGSRKNKQGDRDP